jgi:CBS domain-containing protein
MLVERVLPIAHERLITIPADACLSEAANLLSKNAHRSLAVVCDPDGVMVGIITKTDVLHQIGHCQGNACAIKAAAVMTREVTSCHPGDSLQEVLSIMKERGFVHVPIVDQHSRPSGVLNVRDGLQALLTEIEYDGALLRDYVMSVGYH